MPETFCLRPVTLLKKSLWHRCFPVNFVKFLRTPFLTESRKVGMQESIKAMFIFEKIFAHIETLQNTFSRHMYKMVSRGTSHYISGDHF